ncbi:monovalent cation/H(+) antiporter subunit G [Labedaea rhizosphaerae]|uniref:Na+/H+ antiporter subunit n=1 Tax=Labedaea rhizosphaerae TaxID=598644 RepID=A0A4R6SH73_LABRH|nr:monovalent cation/H(+) antiporter subunit G [Labedaea rhizosphaerae]TDQ00880.1 Na+/H+ antiporter subunit [Labedaea rhizosphaerae]
MSVLTAVLVALGILVVIGCAVRAAAARDDLVRLHMLAPVTALGVPLLGLGVAITASWTWTTGTVVLIVVLLAVTGPPLTGAIANMIAATEQEDR